MIWRVRERATFERLRADGQRIRPLAPPAGATHRRRSLWCSFLPDSRAVPPRIAFAIGRKVGPAVTRNLLRRRIRAIVTEADSQGLVAPGTYLFGAHVSVTELGFADLRREVRDLLAGATGSEASDDRP